jgi:DNA-directed RNA polymerase subunit beta'
MLDVNNFNAVRIMLASPETIRSWSRGEVTKPETINYRTLKPERDGLFCERIFGPTKDWECACGKYKRVRYKGIVCDKCGVEVTRAKVRRERMGHIELASSVSHIWFVKGTPSRIGLLLDMTPRVLEQVLYFAKYVITDVDEEARQRAIQQVEGEMETRVSQSERGGEERVAKLQEELNARIEELQSEKESRLRELKSRRESSIEAVKQTQEELDLELEDLVGKSAPRSIMFEPAETTLVEEGAAVRAEHRNELGRLAQERIDRIEFETEEEQAKVSARADAEVDARRYQVDEQISEIRSKAASEMDSITMAGESRIKKIEQIKVMQTLSEMEHRELVEQCGRIFSAGMGADAVRDLIQRVDLDQLAAQLRAETRSSSGQRRKKATKRLRVVESFRKSGNRPEWMILTVLPVLPPDLRPMVQLDGGRFATSDLNDLYRRVINRNNRLRRLLDLGAPEIIIRNEKRMLQEAVDSLIDNGRRGRAVSGSSNHKLKSLSDMLKGKQGRFRQNLLGKRVDYSGRSVIVVGPELKLHQCGLPKKMALELFKPFVMRKLVERNHAHNIKSAKRIVERVKSEVWDVLEEVISEHPVLLNRAPTLHRLGIQAFMPVLIEGSAIQIHPLVCSAFNADFDGDQMAVHVPLSGPAKDEARRLLLSTYNLLLPSNGEPVVSPTLDMVLGCYYMTMIKPGAKGEGRSFGDLDDARLAYDLGQVELHAEIKVRIDGGSGNGAGTYISTSVGRILFNEVLPPELGFRNERMDKGALKRVVAEVFRRFRYEKTAEVVDQIKRIGFEFATKSGITIAIEDIKIPEQKETILSVAETDVARVEKDYRRGLISDEERYNEIIRIWTKAKEDVTTAVSQALDPYGSVNLMASSGAKGNVQQISQMAGMRGLMADPSGRIIELPIRSSFRGGLTVLEYFLSTHGARKGLADTAIRTADSGYLTRRLIDVAQNVIVHEEDCGTENGIWLDGLTPENADRARDKVLGRLAAEAVVDSSTGEVVIDRNEMIDEVALSRILDLPMDQIYARSPLTCESRFGVCQQCYGRHLGSGELVSIGDAVGIVAAQSIGEPGTQLTMRTFHTGGVAGLDITSGLPRVEELFEARVPKGEAVLSEIDGVVQVERGEDRRVIRVVSRETYRDDYPIPDGYDVRVQLGDSVSAGDPLAMREDAEPVLARVNGVVEAANGTVTLSYEEVEEREYDVAPSARIKVEDSQPVNAGDQLTEGSRNPQDILRIQGKEEVQRYLVEEVQEVYRSQGVSIHYKHIEIIVRQMLRKLRVDFPGDTDLLPGELIDRFTYEEKNRQVLAEGGEPATAQPVLMGVTKASLNTDSFLAAASFQETTKVLTEAAISGKTDYLMGLKENVIIGKLIPAGTGVQARRLAAREARSPWADWTTEAVESAAATATLLGGEPEVVPIGDLPDLDGDDLTAGVEESSSLDSDGEIR